MDTRCANPGLQLDVDIMILEYTLFQAIQAQFHLLSSELGSNAEQGNETQTRRELAIFDSFVRIFNARHSGYEHDAGSHFRLDVLEFLVLLSGLLPSPSLHFTNRMLEELKVQAKADLEARRAWQAARARHFRRLEKQPACKSDAMVHRDVEMQIYEAWKRTEQASTPAPDSEATKVFVLLSLTSRFMTISAKFFGLMEEMKPGLTREWIQVACELIFRTSLESLRLQTQYRCTDNLPTLEDCFAWGYIEPDTSVDIAGASNEEITDLINQMFRLGDTEDRDWTKFRLETLYEFSIATDASVSSQSSRLERLADRYPLEAFHTNLVPLLQNIWQLSCRDDLLGKPALVELEEGHLASLDIVGAEFERFASKVGLRSLFDSLEHINAPEGLSSTKGLLAGPSLSERYEHELKLEQRRQANGHANGTSPVIKLE
ncbi:hypothetical protein H2200_004793 [Cladophialophora chaetospira]|uniref:Uncharacterized protein n=1 Tax=Cladophialophora chaetospira TaxID=386627 RepID=A0AA38XEF1_9EURO|nr:hypothetical protein H2200_004793 [Cladophialophora chaetospira]